MNKENKPLILKLKLEHELCLDEFIYLYGVFKREVDGGNIIHLNKMMPIIKWHHHRLPKRYHLGIIEDMTRLGLLKKISRDNFEIITVPKRINPPIDGSGNPLWGFL